MLRNVLCSATRSKSERYQTPHKIVAQERVHDTMYLHESQSRMYISDASMKSIPQRYAPSAALASIFRLAARIISSLRLFSPSALAALSELQACRFCSSDGSASFPLPLTRDCRLYLVIKSCCEPVAGFEAAGDVRVGAGIGSCGWNVGGGVSSVLPDSTRSVVADTEPPFLCKSHAIALLSNCGNMPATCSTFVASIRCAPGFEDVELLGPAEVVGFMNHRIAKKPMTATAMS